jgi:hypothetical protein
MRGGNMKQILLSFFLTMQGWAISCGIPVEISDYVGIEAFIRLNDQGSSTLFWEEFEIDQDRKVFKVSLRDNGLWWKTIDLASEDFHDGYFRMKRTDVDREGNISLFWQWSSFSPENEKMHYLTGVQKLASEPAGLLVLDKFDYERIFKDDLTFIKGAEEVFNRLRENKPPLFIDTADFHQGGQVYCDWKNQDGDSLCSEYERIFDQGFNYRYDFDNVKVVKGLDGTLYIAGEVKREDDDDWDESIRGVFFIKYNPGSPISEPTLFLGSDSSKYPEDFFIDLSGNLLILWRSSSSILYATYKPIDEEADFVQLTSSDEICGKVIVESDVSGRFLLVFELLKNLRFSAIYGRCFDGEWSDPIRLTPIGESCLLKSISLNNKGKGVIAFEAERPQIGKSALRVVDLNL